MKNYNMLGKYTSFMKKYKNFITFKYEKLIYRPFSLIFLVKALIFALFDKRDHKSQVLFSKFFIN